MNIARKRKLFIAFQSRTKTTTPQPLAYQRITAPRTFGRTRPICRIFTTLAPLKHLVEALTTSRLLPSGSQTLAAPTSVSASKRNNTNVYVSWQNSNSGNLKYEVEYWSDGSSRHTITTYFTDLTVSNLTPGQNYSFRVRALTDSEDAYSPWSDSYSVSL